MLQVLQMRSETDTLAFVSDSLNALESGCSFTMLKRVAKAWANSDYEGMEHFDEWCECFNTVSKRVVIRRAIDERNPALAENIDALHRDGNAGFRCGGQLAYVRHLGFATVDDQS